MPESKRLFMAVTFEADVKAALFRQGQRLRQAGVQAGFTPQSNLHLTLVFLGETPFEDAARRALDRVTAVPFMITVGGFGRFEKRSGDVLWVGVHPYSALLDMQQALANALRSERFCFEARSYRPHVTLARRARLPKGLELADFNECFAPLDVPVSGVSLMESRRDAGRLVYVPLYRTLFSV